ncbi:hypothetical protein VTO42DRAFT_572 [Malbranchea cinnamomea]
MSQNSKPEKTMSSRLLTMKFMQRAAAAGLHSSPSPATPNRGDDSTDDSVPPAKRRRSDQTGPASLTSGAASSDLQAISAAIKAEEEKRAAAIAKQAAEAGETNWVLEYPSHLAATVAGTKQQQTQAYKVVPMGSYDASDDFGQLEEECDGRRGYGGFKRKKPATDSRQSLGTTVNGDEDTVPASLSSLSGRRREDDNADDEEEDEDAQAHLNDMIRDHKYRTEREEARRRKLAQQEARKEHREDKALRKLKTISGGGGISKPPKGRHGWKKGKKR